MYVRSVFFKAIALCAVLFLSSCQSQEEKVISRINDLAEQIEKNASNWDEQDWVDAMNEYTQICQDAQKCNFSNEQLVEVGNASGKIAVAVGKNSANVLAKGMDAFSNELAKGMDAYSNVLAKGMKSTLGEMSDEEDLDDEEDTDAEEDMDPEEDLDAEEDTDAEEDMDDEDSDDEIEDNGHIKVYSNCYDGYLNIRAEPTSKSKILGTLPNGPKGAELLGVEGKWSKVRVNGVVGYIWSADVKSTPTDPVYISASDVVGTWYACDGAKWGEYSIKSNGKYSLLIYDTESDYGTWYLSHDKIVLKSSQFDGTTACPVKGGIIKIDGRNYRK